ncbi:unnamed protein product [Aspergillus oryzae]|nr:unnamed protein product [Aspergillus oryzae]
MAPGLRKRSHGWFESKSTVSTANGVHHEGYDNHSPGWVRNAMDRLTAPNRQGQTSLVINKRLKAESFGYPRDYRVDRRIRQTPSPIEQYDNPTIQMIPRRRGNTIGRLQIGQSQIVHEIGNVINYMGFSIHYLIGNGVTDQFPFQNSNPWLSTLKVRLHFRAVTSEPKPGMHVRLPRLENEGKSKSHKFTLLHVLNLLQKYANNTHSNCHQFSPVSIPSNQ